MKMEHEHMPCGTMEESSLYRIGVFAAMNHVTVKALRFYEEQGLLLSALIHPETGYRYYALSQMAELHRMMALKQAGFTLEEIAQLNAGADEEALLLKKKGALLSKIAELTRQIAVVDGYLSGQKARLASPVLIKTIPATTVACLQTRLASYDALFDRMPEMGALMKQADWLIDVGPDGGTAGGEIVFAGTPRDMAEKADTITAEYLRKSLGSSKAPAARLFPAAGAVDLPPMICYDEGNDWGAGRPCMECETNEAS